MTILAKLACGALLTSGTLLVFACSPEEAPDPAESPGVANEIASLQEDLWQEMLSSSAATAVSRRLAR